MLFSQLETCPERPLPALFSSDRAEGGVGEGLQGELEPPSSRAAWGPSWTLTSPLAAPEPAS